MLFSIIFTVDVPRETSVIQFLPGRKIRRRMQQTEGDEQYEFSYLEGPWTRGKHRKLCGILNREQFEQFLFETGLFAEDVQTMGSLGAPGCGFGLAPAVSFRSDEPEAIMGAYVTPLCDRVRESRFPMGEEDWERVRRAIIRVYG